MLLGRPPDRLHPDQRLQGRRRSEPEAGFAVQIWRAPTLLLSSSAGPFESPLGRGVALLQEETVVLLSLVIGLTSVSVASPHAKTTTRRRKGGSMRRSQADGAIFLMTARRASFVNRIM